LSYPSAMPYKDKRVRNAYNNERNKRNRLEWIAEHGPCVDCGGTDRLQVDHIDPLTKITHRVWSWSPARRRIELEKCAVRCYECHLTKTKVDLRRMDPNAHLRRIDPPGMAWCTMHQDFLPVGEFTNNRAKRRGLETECKACRKKMREKKRVELHEIFVGGDLVTSSR
jgi:hypothetical protein